MHGNWAIKLIYTRTQLQTMVMLIPVKSIVMPSKRAQTWPGISASLFACLLLGQLAATVDAETFVGQGEVGGYVNSYAAYGRIAAEDTMRTLKGDRRGDIPLLERTNIKPFDWPVLERWGIKESRLSTGSIVLNRQSAVWEAYRPYVAIAIVLLFAQTMLILELLRQRKKERIVRRHLRESEARFREAESIAQCGSWVWDVSRNKTHWSDEMYRILGLVPQSVPPTASLIHPGDDQYYVAKMKEASDTHQIYSAEHRIVRPNGEERVVLEAGQPKYDAQQRLISIVGTLLDITEQRQAERVLRESEDRFRAMADGAPVMMWMSGVDKLCTDFNRGWLAFTGRSIEQEIGNGWVEGVHPDDLQRCLAVYVEAFEKRQPFYMEYRLRRYDGDYHWINDAGSPRFLADGTFAGYIGCCVDIHDRKAAELARLELARRLMSAQEAERTRVARELHDGIGQEIALLGIQMQRVAASGPLDAESLYPRMQKLCANLTAIGLHVSHISHRLHSSELEYLGLSVAITQLCREFSEQYSINVACACTNIPTQLDNEIALTLLRVVQESLHNIAKHSNARDVEVSVTGASGNLTLNVRDNGVGFDNHQPRAGAGLGLISMRERVHLIGGEFTIDSAPGAGTRIWARTPGNVHTPVSKI
jgi:PAS domain S-box-containing protein